MAGLGDGAAIGIPRVPIAAAWALADFSYADFQVAVAALAGLKGRTATDPALARAVARGAVAERGGRLLLTERGRELALELSAAVDVPWQSLRRCVRAAAAEASLSGPSALAFRSRPPGMLDARVWSASAGTVDWAVMEVLAPAEALALRVLSEAPVDLAGLAAGIGADSAAAAESTLRRLVDHGLAFDASPGASDRDAEWLAACEAAASARRDSPAFLTDPDGVFSALRRRALFVYEVERTRDGARDRHNLESDAKSLAIVRSRKGALADAMIAACADRPVSRATIAAAAGLTLERGYPAKVLREIMAIARTRGGLRELEGLDTGPHRLYVSGASWAEGGAKLERWNGLEHVVLARRLHAGMAAGIPCDRTLSHVYDSRAFFGEMLQAWDEGLSLDLVRVWTVGEVVTETYSWGRSSCDLGYAARPRGWRGYAGVGARLVADDGTEGWGECSINDVRGFEGRGDEIMLSLSSDQPALLRPGTAVMVDARVAAMLGGAMADLPLPPAPQGFAELADGAHP